MFLLFCPENVQSRRFGTICGPAKKAHSLPSIPSTHAMRQNQMSQLLQHTQRHPTNAFQQTVSRFLSISLSSMHVNIQHSLSLNLRSFKQRTDHSVSCSRTSVNAHQHIYNQHTTLHCTIYCKRFLRMGSWSYLRVCAASPNLVSF